MTVVKIKKGKSSKHLAQMTKEEMEALRLKAKKASKYLSKVKF